MRLHHVGIACEDAGKTAASYETLLGVSVCHQEAVDDVGITFLELPNGYIELLEPIDVGPVKRFIESNGPGLHHIALETGDIERALGRAVENGIDLVDETPRPGAMGHEIAFLHPKSTGGVLVEFVET